MSNRMKKDAYKYITALAHFLFIFSLWMVHAFLPIHFKEIGLPDASIGFLIGIFSASYLLLVFPAGHLSDRFRIIHLTRIGILFFSFYTVGLIFVSRFLWLALLMVVGGIGAAIITVSLTSLFYKRFSSQKRGRNIGMFSFANALGYALGPLSAGLLLPWFGMQGVFIGSLCAICSLFFLSFRLEADEVYTLTGTPIFKNRIDFRSTFRRRDIKILFAAVIVFSGHLGMEQSSLSLYLEETLSQSLPSIGSLYALIGIWVGVNSYLLGRLFDRFKTIFPFLLLGTFVSGFFQIFTVVSSGYWDFLTIRLFHTVGDAGTILITGVMTSLVFKEEVMGEGLGIVFCLRMATIFASATICGFLNGLFGYEINFLTTGLLAIAFGIFIVMNRHRLGESFAVHSENSSVLTQ